MAERQTGGMSGFKMGHECKLRLDSDVNRSRYQTQIHILYAEAVSLFYDSGYGLMGKYIILPRTVSTIKKVLLQHQKQTKEGAGARC